MDRKAARRQAVLEVFKEFLNHLDDSCAVKGPAVCPAGPCGGGGGPGGGFGGGVGGAYAQLAQQFQNNQPTKIWQPPREFDWKDPSKRPLITFPDREVQSRSHDKGIDRQKPICPVMDPRCPASFVAGTPTGGGGFTGSYNIGGGGFAGGYTPCANGYGMEMGMGAGMGAVCPATAYTGTGAGPMRASPCTAAILERERQERERQEREIRERMERERIERERKELDRREKDLRARKPYMCPGQHKFEEEMLKAARKAHLVGKNKIGNSNVCKDTSYNNPVRSGGEYRSHAHASPQERFGPCVAVEDLAPCDLKACPASSNIHIPLQEVKSRELRGGVLYTGCDCNKRNGLQHDCKRTLCQGRPECLTKPEPMCIPSGGPGYISPCYPVCEPPCWNEPVKDRYC
ncbi:uncharacterized protein [Periplaneta americana]|uniref:uncharacterized protein isoform X2 n=1 Tax=Periplaneta americana TaxID=6978 RepID=UPI0037E8B620